MNFYKNIIIILLISSLTNCVSRNEYGIARPSKIRFSNKKCYDSNVFNKIDTSAIYLTEYEWPENNIKHYNGYKFYSENKVAFFINIKIDSLNSLNPERAQMGFYSTCSIPYNMQTVYFGPSGIFRSYQEFEIIEDTLVVTTLKSPQASKSVEKYFKRNLKPHELICKPDW